MLFRTSNDTFGTSKLKKKHIYQHSRHTTTPSMRLMSDESAQFGTDIDMWTSCQLEIVNVRNLKAEPWRLIGHTPHD